MILRIQDDLKGRSLTGSSSGPGLAWTAFISDVRRKSFS